MLVNSVSVNDQIYFLYGSLLILFHLKEELEDMKSRFNKVESECLEYKQMVDELHGKVIKNTMHNSIQILTLKIY